MIRVGKVVRLHSNNQPDRAKLYLISDGKDYYSHGLVTPGTVKNWIESGLRVTFYDEVIESKKEEIKKLDYIVSPEYSAEVLFITEDNKEEVWEFAKSSTLELDRQWFDKGYDDTIGFYAVKSPDDYMTVLSENLLRDIFYT